MKGEYEMKDEKTGKSSTQTLKNKKILALIPARGNSKSIPKKNLLELHGHPLIAYSIVIAKLSKYIDRVIVTTDNEEIAKIARQYGAEVPFMRPDKYAKDDSTDIEFFKHALGWLEKNEDYIPDYVVHLRPTAPLRNAAIIDKSIELIHDDIKATSLRTGQYYDRNCYKNFKINNKYIEFFGKQDFAKDEEYYNLPRQQLPKTYEPNSYVDVIIPNVLKETGSLHGKFILAFIAEPTPDIDTYDDLPLVEKAFHNKEFKPLLDKLNKMKINEMKK